MTCQEIGTYIEKQQEKEKNSYIQESTIQYRIAQYILNIVSAKHPRNYNYDDLFPELIEKTTSKEEEIEKRWREFLGVVK